MRVLSATGSASAASDVAIGGSPSTASALRWRPGRSPSVQTACTMPSASEVSASGAMRPVGSATVKRTGTPAIGRPPRDTICALSGTARRCPAGARCPSPARSVIVAGIG